MRYIHFLILGICQLFILSVSVTFAADGDPDPFFLTGNGFSDEVRDIALQPDGKLIVVGKFTSIVGVPFNRIARLDISGHIDFSFNPGIGANGDINTVKLLPDGKILIGGSFSNYNGIAIRNFARLNSDGTIDASFNIGTGPNISVNQIILQPDNQLLVAGGFSTFNDISRQGVARLSFDGVVDQTFSPPTSAVLFMNGPIKALALQADGKILIGGFFFHGQIEFIKNIARLNPNGSLDTSFQVKIDSPGQDPVSSIFIRDDGKILVGGNYSMVNGVQKFGIVLINVTGTLDNSFNATNVNRTLKINIQSDGKIVVVGSIQLPQNESSIARLNSNGSLDTSFITSEPTSNPINTFIFAPDNKIIAGGKMFRNPNTIGGADPVGVRRFNSDGSRDYSYITRTGATDSVNNIVVQPDGKIVFRAFGLVGGLTRNGLARLYTDGTVDASYAPNISGDSIATQTDGSIIISNVSDNTGRRFFRKVNSNGSIDQNYGLETETPSNTFPAVREMVTQPDGKIIAVGNFISVSGITRRSLVRLNADGSVDDSFNSNIVTTAGSFNNVSLEPNGKMWVSGAVQNTGGVYRLNAAGIAETFTQILGVVNDLSPIGNGKVYICGDISSVSSIPVNKLARLNNDGTLDSSFISPTLVGSATIFNCLAQSNGKIIISGDFATVNGIARRGFARLNADGSVDSSITTMPSNSEIRSIVRQPDGNLLIGGNFFSINNLPKQRIARLLFVSKSKPFDFDGDGKTDISIFRPAPGEWWVNRSSNGGNFATQFGSSSDKIVPADYTGDGKTDVVFWRPSTGQWFILRSEDSSFFAFPFGAAGDVPVPADYDGDGKADAAVFRESSLTWFINKSSGGTDIIGFGAAGDKPVVGDYDGDGKADIAIFRANGANGAEWWINRSSNNSVFAATFGNSTDKPTQGDYTGDGKADIAVWRPSNGNWLVLRSEDFSFFAFPFGTTNDVPVAGDYDGDGKFDAGVFRPSNNTWFIQRSTAGTLIQQFGIAGDVPVPNVFVP